MSTPEFLRQLRREFERELQVTKTDGQIIDLMRTFDSSVIETAHNAFHEQAS